MEDVNDWYELMAYIINKNQQGYLPPAKFNLVINQGQYSYQSFLLGSFQSYMNGRPVARVELGNNAVVRQRLAPTIKKLTLTIDATGNADYPANFLQSDSMHNTAMKRVRLVQQDSLDANYNSVIDPIATNPIYLIEDTRFQFYPLTLGSAKLSFVKKAPLIVWGYTPDANGRPIYNVGTSVQPVWDSVAKFEIISRALKLVGINLQSSAVIQLSNQIQTQGQ